MFYRYNPTADEALWAQVPNTTVKDLENYFVVDKILGAGQQGITYLLKDGRVLKLTVSRRESIVAAWLLENPRPQTFPIVYEVYDVENVPLYAIIREEIPNVERYLMRGSPQWRAIQAIYSPRPEGSPIEILEKYGEWDTEWQDMSSSKKKEIIDLLQDSYAAHISVIRDDGIRIRDSIGENLGIRDETGEPLIRDFGSADLKPPIAHYQPLLASL